VKPGDAVVERLDRDGVELHKSGCPRGGTVDIFIEPMRQAPDRKSTRLNSSHITISYAVFSLRRKESVPDS